MDRIETHTVKGVLPCTRAVATPTPVSNPQTQQGHDMAMQAPAGTSRSVSAAGATPPVDGDRVTEIRKAIESGRYPIVPTKIADAMIAAGFLLRMD